MITQIYTQFGKISKNIIDYIQDSLLALKTEIYNLTLSKTYSVVGSTSCSIAGLDFSIGKAYKFNGSYTTSTSSIGYITVVAGTYTGEIWVNGTRTAINDTSGARFTSASDSVSPRYYDGYIHIGNGIAFIEVYSWYSSTSFSFCSVSVPITNSTTNGYIALTRASATLSSLYVQEDK